MSSVGAISDQTEDTRQKIKRNQEELEALADSDLPAARIADALLRLANE